jgi:hypothetical protein
MPSRSPSRSPKSPTKIYKKLIMDIIDGRVPTNLRSIWQQTWEEIRNVIVMGTEYRLNGIFDKNMNKMIRISAKENGKYVTWANVYIKTY